MKYECPCCGNRTLKEEGVGTFEICPVCFWENDNVQFEDPDFTGGANEVSLNQARQNYQEFRASARQHLSHVRPPLPYEIPSTGRA
ncbi:hydrolase [Nostoc sp. UCD121]|nr:hydrolase [Nostoc sp. UCD120]MBC1274964.1 hydrolase [Nostoc sp. UCD121]MBC1297406.1 hydrolase [Nostoc sp. UCD122]